jgi:hypothetical protein
MVIDRLLKNSTLEPQEISRITEAYEQALHTICVKDRDDPLTEMIAKQIIKIAQAGVHERRSFRLWRSQNYASGKAASVGGLPGPRPRSTNMTPHIPQEFSTRLIDWSPFVIMGNTMPPRDPDEDEADEDEEEEEGEGEEDRADEPPVVREPDED